MTEARGFWAAKRMAVLAVGALCLSSVCVAVVAQDAPGGAVTVKLGRYVEPWVLAQPRFRDVANREYAPAFRSGPQAYSYDTAEVTLTYEREQPTPFFSGHLAARGLKPNFAYQVKLAGKPVRGNRGTGTQLSFVGVNSSSPGATPSERLVRDRTGQATPIHGDDWANQQLGYAGRWWDETAPPSTNLNDAYYQRNYPDHTIYGYLFMGTFVTDEQGGAEVDVNSRTSLHVTWQDAQKGAKQVPAGEYSVGSTQPPYYGYGKPVPPAPVKLWYEYQSDRPHEVQLAPGIYHCRLLITEESFHGAGGNGNVDGVVGPNSGVWKTVLASERFGARTPANDIVFTLGTPPLADK